ncbi:MAG: NAD(P)H-binding protein, partial [Sinobacteraceae bacterium]|nr:NAD(P)H-binding protein [Nevskiaceae bacterium]
ELVSRGHQVIAIARDPARVPHNAEVIVKQDDLSEPKRIAAAIDGADAVISAYAPPQDKPEEIVDVTHRQVEAFNYGLKARLIVVGGAGGLNVAPDVSLIDSGYLPAAYLPIATAHVDALNVLRDSKIDWTYLAPAADFSPGERTGRFRLGRDELIADAQQQSRISMEDYAVALVDELETPKHRRQRFSVGY